MLFDLRTTMCPSCGKQMMNKATRHLFPYSCDKNQDFQMKKNGVVYISDSTADDEYICVECKDSGKSSFICALCGERKSTSEVEDSFGCSPTEYLCTCCYATTPAKIWDEKVEKLATDHRYDFD